MKPIDSGLLKIVNAEIQKQGLNANCLQDFINYEARLQYRNNYRKGTYGDEYEVSRHACDVYIKYLGMGRK